MPVRIFIHRFQVSYCKFIQRFLCMNGQTGMQAGVGWFCFHLLFVSVTLYLIPSELIFQRFFSIHSPVQAQSVAGAWIMLISKSDF